MLTTRDFDFVLDPSRIAQTPCEPRDASRLLVLHRDRLGHAGETPPDSLEHRRFQVLPQYLAAGDTLVINHSKVIPARLYGERVPTGGKVEILLVRREPPGMPATIRWLCLTQSGGRMKAGDRVHLAPAPTSNMPVQAILIERRGQEGDVVEFSMAPEHFDSWLRHSGQMPLPPYIARDAKSGLSPSELSQRADLDAERYQTVYAKAEGSVAAPTAGLHFTPALLAAIQARGVRIAELVLHVGPGTFRPVKAETLTDHTMHEEFYEIPASCVEAIAAARTHGKRVVAVGTTTLRALESACLAAEQTGSVAPGARTMPKAGPGSSRLFVHPPWSFRCVDGLVTNFHLPKSTLLMLVAAFAAPGREAGVAAIQAAYRCAIENEYRFFSYGDAMLLI